jgi:hypothetical protein
LDRERDKRSKQIFRANQSEDDRELEQEKARDRMAKLSRNKTKEENDYKIIVTKQRVRKWRETLSGKEHLLGNLKSKKGMQQFKSNRRVVQFLRRESSRKDCNAKWDEEFDWERYMRKSQRHSEKLLRDQPDIVARINEKARV